MMSPSPVLWLWCLLGVVAFARGAVWYTYVDEDPRYPGYCVYEKMVIKAGTSTSDYGCSNLNCRKCTAPSCEGRTHGYILVGSTCPTMNPRPPCYDGVVKLPYPECCLYPQC